MEDDPNKPIMVSEVPPQRKPRAMSFFSRLEQSRSAISESSIPKAKTGDSSSSKSFTQTMIEKWVNMASQRYENEVDSDDLLPPWVPPIRPVQRTASQRLESPTIKDEKGFSDDNSECSLPSIGEQTTQTEIALYTEDYSIQSNDKSLSLSSGPDDELEAYRESCSVTEDSYHPAAPEIYKTFHNKNNDDNSQASIQFDSQATVQYDSQVTIQYDAQSDNSQETVQYDLREPILHDRQLSDSRDLESHDFNTDSQPSTYNHSQDEVNTPEPYTHNDNQVNIETASLTNSSPYENAEDHTSKSSSPNIFLSPVNDNEFLQYFSPPHVPSTLQQDNFFESLSSPIIETKSIESGGSTTRKHSLQYTSDTESSSPTKSATKSQKLNKVEKKEKGKCKESSSSIRLAQSQEAIKLIRPEKRQLRSSTLKAPKTIETYFSNSLGTSQEGESDIGRESVPPSNGYLDTDLKKEGKDDKKDPVVDRRRRPRIGLSKNAYK